MSDDRFPLNEVLGFPTDNHSDDAFKHREEKLCRFSDYLTECNKTNAGQVIGTCSNQHRGDEYIVCPHRMEEDNLLFEDAATEALGEDIDYEVLKEVRLQYEDGGSVGDIDFVVVNASQGEIKDFASLEVQTVYTSGNSSRPVNYYLENPKNRGYFDWRAKVEEINNDDSQGNTSYVSPDWKSSHRKRLVPQVLQKGRILNEWGITQVIATQDSLFNDLGKDFQEVEREQSDLIWLLYDIYLDEKQNKYNLILERVVHSTFDDFQETFSEEKEPETKNDFKDKLKTDLAGDKRLDISN